MKYSRGGRGFQDGRGRIRSRTVVGLQADHGLGDVGGPVEQQYLGSSNYEENDIVAHGSDVCRHGVGGFGMRQHAKGILKPVESRSVHELRSNQGRCEVLQARPETLRRLRTGQGLSGLLQDYQGVQ